MPFDVELMRELLFELEMRQTSPPSMVKISIDETAINLGRSRTEIESSLTGLFDLDYLAGRGSETPGFFAFRRLTRKGAQFVQMTRRPRDWMRLKRHFALRHTEGGRLTSDAQPLA